MKMVMSHVWPSVVVGAAAALLIVGRPRDPTFHVISISLSSFRLNLPLLDLEFTIVVHVTNPNLVPIRYSASTVSISYRGSHLGSAQLQAASQPPLSCQLIHMPARLDGLQMAQHVGSILVDIGGVAKLLFVERRFSAHVESHVVVDPVFLDVVDQENITETTLLA